MNKEQLIEFLEEAVDALPTQAVPVGASSYQIGGTHYKTKALDTWDALQAWLPPGHFESYLIGNAVKYLCRYRDKGGAVDLQKAIHYIEKAIEVRGDSIK